MAIYMCVLFRQLYLNSIPGHLYPFQRCTICNDLLFYLPPWTLQLLNSLFANPLSSVFIFILRPHHCSGNFNCAFNTSMFLCLMQFGSFSSMLLSSIPNAGSNNRFRWQVQRNSPQVYYGFYLRFCCTLPLNQTCTLFNTNCNLNT